MGTTLYFESNTLSNMILSTDEFKNMGFRASEDDSNIGRAIKDSELYWLKSVIGDENYIHYLELDPETATDEEISALNGGKIGTTFVGGLKEAIAHYAYSMLLKDSVTAVRYGTVNKSSEYSSPSGDETIYDVCKYHSEIARAYVRELFSYLGIEKHIANDYFSENDLVMI